MIKATFVFSFISFCASLGSAALAQTSSAAAIEKGRVTYIQNGCWQCHGFVGQGGVAGLKLAPDPKPVEFYEVFVRHSNGPMPPYSEKILTKAELASIHTYLKSIPKGPAAGSIELLK
jgi:ubiquinol-cytochrome c reductase cytochrome c subunit